MWGALWVIKHPTLEIDMYEPWAPTSCMIPLSRIATCVCWILLFIEFIPGSSVFPYEPQDTDLLNPAGSPRSISRSQMVNPCISDPTNVRGPRLGLDTTNDAVTISSRQSAQRCKNRNNPHHLRRQLQFQCYRWTWDIIPHFLYLVVSILRQRRVFYLTVFWLR
jgi:hypothetical protein